MWGILDHDIRSKDLDKERTENGGRKCILAERRYFEQEWRANKDMHKFDRTLLLRVHLVSVP